MGKSTKGNKGDQTISTIPTSKHLPGDNLSSLPNPQTLPPLPSARLDRFKLYVRHTFNEIKTRKLNYCLGAMSCFIVVSVVALTVSALYQAPVVFLSLSEASTSETDLKISAGTWTGNSHVNYTRIKDQLVQDGNPQFKLHTPRFEFRTPFFKWDSSLGLDPTNSTWMYSGSTATNNAGCNRFPRSWTKKWVFHPYHTIITFTFSSTSLPPPSSLPHPPPVISSPLSPDSTFRKFLFLFFFPWPCQQSLAHSFPPVHSSTLSAASTPCSSRSISLNSSSWISRTKKTSILAGHGL
eukprot:TRINITY_DN1148_c0_g2_i1.p1 TRINITY_DN1148_c0_g2~~TRINITY_DN1148_c0_g2_i1.p1  ORF type:complete len:295 (+),score=41.03 TRINITY_DN1148_c0_g2_i1:138-1022(+)